MAWSGGTFTRTNGVNTGATTWATDESGGVGIVSSRHDTHDQDLATGINQCINKDGSNTATQLNVDNLRVDGNTVSSTDSNGNINLTPNGTGRTVITQGGAAVSGYVSGTHTYWHSDGGHATSFDVDSNVTESTFESVGPTGSSATNIWTAMDDVPEGARIAIVLVLANISGVSSADSNPTINVYARATGSAAAAANTNSILNSGYLVDDHTNGNTYNSEIAHVPLDASRRFDVNWVATGDTGREIFLFLKGFIF